MTQFTAEIVVRDDELAMNIVHGIDAERTEGDVLHEGLDLKNQEDQLRVIIVTDEQASKNADSIGRLSATKLDELGGYEATCEIDPEWRNLGLAKAASRPMMQTLMENDPVVDSIEVSIEPEDKAGIATAEALGATLFRPLTKMSKSDTHDVYLVTKVGYLRTQ